MSLEHPVLLQSEEVLPKKTKTTPHHDEGRSKGPRNQQKELPMVKTGIT